jgi:hypothetical protein
MSSSRRRRNKWLRTPELDWVYHNPYYNIYVLCVRIMPEGQFMGKVLLSIDLNKFPQGQELLCGTSLSTCNDDNEIFMKYRSKRYRDSYSRKRRRSSLTNQAILEIQNRNVFYKQYKL